MILKDKVPVIYGAGGAIGGANVAVFLASDQARGMTGTTINLSMGSLDA
jgi:hypothetical protein